MLIDELRAASRTDYLHALLLPADQRETFVTLRLLHATMLDIVAKATEPGISEIRLQWWADGILGLRTEELRSHPLGQALLALIDREPSFRAPLAAKVEAHSRDLYPDAPDDRDQFEGYAGETRSILFQLTLAAGSGDDAARYAAASGHAGVAETVAEQLNGYPQARAKGHVRVPLDMPSSANPDELLEGGAEAETALKAFARYGLDHADRARAALAGLPKQKLFASLAMFDATLRDAEAKPGRVVAGAFGPGPLRRQWLLWRG